MPHPTRPVAGRRVDSASPTFDWTPLPGVTTYRLQLAETDAFETILYDDDVERPVTINLDDVLPSDAATVYWRVRAAEAERWSGTAHFGAPGATDLADESVVVQAEPVPVTPAHEAVIDPHTATFAWEGVPEASGYQLQVAEAETFDAPTLDLTLDRAASLVLYDQLPETDGLHWRVRTLFPEGSAGPWSAAVPFSTSTDVEDVSAMTAAEEEADRADDRARAAGPASEARTSGTMSVLIILMIALGFLLSVGLVAWFG